MGLQQVIRAKPLQTGKFVGILLTVVLGVGGFLRVIDVNGFVDGPTLVDGQFLALVLVPLLSFGLVCVVFMESLLAGYRIVRSDRSLRDQVSGRVGYVALRVTEAALAIVGVTIMFAALPVLFAASTPAPAGVGIMLLLLAVGFGILLASLIRSSAELFVYRGRDSSA